MAALTLLLNNRAFVALITLVVALLGVVAWTRLPIDAFPDVTNTQVTVLTKAKGLAAVDVEASVSYPIEQVMRGLPHVREVRSLSKAELSQVVIVFDDGVETYWSQQVVFQRLAMAKDQLPAGVEPQLGPISTGLGEILQYTLSGEGHSAMDLRAVQDWLVAPRLRPIPGVGEVNSFGGEVKQYQVIVSPEKLVKYGLTVDDVADAVERGNANAGGGVVVRGWEQVYLRGVGLLQDIADIERVVLKARDGAPIYLRDVADVTIGAEPRQGAVTRDGKGEVAAGMIIMLKGENSRDVVTAVKAAIADLALALPKGVRLEVFYDRTTLIEACINTVQKALLEGGLFVILVLFLFVAELRTALVVLVSLPLTFLASFIVMGLAGLTSNLMSLGGLAFSVGMVVDASIVVVENVRRHLAHVRAQELKRRTVAEAVLEVARPVAFSVLIIVIILVPLFSLQGIEGKMFAPLALTMLIALLVSLVVALTVIPVLSEWVLRQVPEREFRAVVRLHRGYVRWLGRAVRHPGATLSIAGVVLLAALALLPFLGTEFLPPLDEGSVAVNVVRLPNASLAGSVKVATFMERRLAKFPEVSTVVSKTGRAEISEDPMGPEQTDVIIMLKPPKEWGSGRTKAELVAAMQQDLAQIPGLRFSFSQPIALRVNELVSGVKSDLAVKVFGPDLSVLKEFADRAAAAVQGIAGATDVKVEQVSGMTQLDVEINREAAARHGIHVADINAVIETAVAGKTATVLKEDERRVAVVVRFPEAARADVDAVSRLLIAAPGGERVPLGELARFNTHEAPAQLSRENGMRRVVTEANVRGRDLGGFVAEVKQRLAPLVAGLSPGYYVTYGGQFENQERAMQRLAVVVPVSLVLILLFLYLALGAVGRAMLVLLNLPFALAGGVIAVVAFGLPVSVSAAVAFIVLLGIAVQNGVVLCAFIQQLRDRGASVHDAVQQGCDLRFRPLLMTALTSFIGHLPMLYATGSGADIQKPLAVVVMGGLITSTLLTLFVLPTIFVLAERAAMRSELVPSREV
jgi:cobalt-zinc-cadmium resistance protein CzcA